MEPASFPDLRNIVPLQAKDFNGKSVENSRKFVMDVKSFGGVLLNTVEGVASVTKNGNVKYSFETTVPSRLDFIGINVISFRFVAADGESFIISNFDSTLGELYDDTQLLNYTVGAELSLSHLDEKPNINSFYYGNEIVYRFKVADKLSGLSVEPGKTELANVYITLKHKLLDRSKPYTSVFDPATTTANGYYYIKWLINPNAVKGDGILSLTALDADGNQLPLYNEGSNKHYSMNVQIGGDLNVNPNTRVTTLFDKTGDKDTVFIVTFSLSCQEKSLKDALLRASVSYPINGNITTLSNIPVATNPVGIYQVSWVLPKKEVVEGTYNVKFFREIDRLKSGDKISKKEATSEDEDVPSIFEVNVEYDVDRFSKLPIRSEIAAIILLGSAFLLVFWKITGYSKTA